MMLSFDKFFKARCLLVYLSFLFNLFISSVYTFPPCSHCQTMKAFLYLLTGYYTLLLFLGAFTTISREKVYVLVLEAALIFSYFGATLRPFLFPCASSQFSCALDTPWFWELKLGALALGVMLTFIVVWDLIRTHLIYRTLSTSKK